MRIKWWLHRHGYTVSGRAQKGTGFHLRRHRRPLSAPILLLSQIPSNLTAARPYANGRALRTGRKVFAFVAARARMRCCAKASRVAFGEFDCALDDYKNIQKHLQSNAKPAGGTSGTSTNSRFESTRLAFRPHREQKGACFFASFGTSCAIGSLRCCPFRA